MREQQFIEQNKEKWREFESLVDKKSRDPERLGKLFIQITDDLSYARTFYPNRSVRVYLNNLAQQVFHKLYRSRIKGRNRFILLISSEIPSAIYHSRRELMLSLVIFSLAVGAGVLSAINDPEFARAILGDSYIEMTEQNIKNQDPMAVYKGDNQFYLFAQLAFNNLRIDFYTFVSGLFFGIWTILMLLYNGVMVGAFQYFFAERGLFSESFLTIWMHGALELSAAVIAGGAGLVLGRGIVFPGTYSRLQSLMLSARSGLKILMIAVIMTTIAAVIESFLTRYTEIPDAVRLIFICTSFLFVVGYFIVLPWMKARNGSILPRPGEMLLPDLNQEIDIYDVKGVGKIFSEGFVLYRSFFRRYLPFAILAAVMYSAFNLIFNYGRIFTGFELYVWDTAGPFYPLVWTFTNLGNVFSGGFLTGVTGANILLSASCLTMIYFSSIPIIRNMSGGNDAGTLPSHRARAIAVSGLLALYVNLMFHFGPLMTYTVILTLPLLLVWMSGLVFDGWKPAGAARAMSASGLVVYGVFGAFLFISVNLFTLFTYPVFSMAFMLGDMLIGIGSFNINKLFIGLYLFFTSFALLVIAPSIVCGLMITYFTGKEILTASGLERRLTSLAETDMVERGKIR